MLSWLSGASTLVMVSCAVQVGAIAACFIAESWRRHSWAGLRAIRLKVAHLVPLNMAHGLLGPIGSGVTVLAVNVGGGGLIELAHSGAGVLFSLLVYTMAMDSAEYVFHRMQHAIPALWAMHSLRHSDTAMDASTTQRRFGADQTVKSLTVY